MGAVKSLLTDPENLFFLSGFDHYDGEGIVLVVQEELMDYIYECHSSVSFDTNEPVSLTSKGRVKGGDEIRIDEFMDLTLAFMQEECG
jgi:hypothetical protein